jgi:hypothetical protein
VRVPARIDPIVETVCEVRSRGFSPKPETSRNGNAKMPPTMPAIS